MLTTSRLPMTDRRPVASAVADPAIFVVPGWCDFLMFEGPDAMAARVEEFVFALGSAA